VTAQIPGSCTCVLVVVMSIITESRKLKLRCLGWALVRSFSHTSQKNLSFL